MENTQSRPVCPVDREAVRHLLEQALAEGVIRSDRLQPYLDRLGVPAERGETLYALLREKGVRVISCVEEPEYIPDRLQAILQLLEQRPEILSERERLILDLRLREQKTLTQVAEELGLSRERVRQIECKAVRLLGSRAMGRNRKIRDFYE